MGRVHLSASLALSLLLTACSHDATRENPLDPELTPPVQLTAVSDDSAGTVRLSWSAAQGQFAEYWVLRNRSRQTDVDTLARIAERVVHGWVDTVDADLEFVYRVSILAPGGLEVASANVRPTPIGLASVEIESLGFDSRDATATLAWQRYAGPRFERYEVHRSIEGEEPVLVASLTDPGATALADSHLLGNTEYRYRVNVVTTRGEVAEGLPSAGRFHEQVAAWPLDVDDGDHARLYWEQGRLHALIAGEQRVDLVEFGAEGSVLDERRLLGNELFRNRPWTAALAFVEGGGRSLTLSSQEGDLVLMTFDEQGRPVNHEVTVADTMLAPGETPLAPGLSRVDIVNGFFDSVAFSSRGSRLAELTAGSVETSEWSHRPSVGCIGTEYAIYPWGIAPNCVLERTLELDWEAFRYEGDMLFWDGFQQLQLVDASGDVLILGVNRTGFFTFLRGEVLSRDFPFVSGLKQHAVIEFEPPRLRTWIETPISWHEATTDGDGVTAGVGVGEEAMIFAEQGVGLVDPDGDERFDRDIQYDVAEVRSWVTADGLNVGVCAVDLNQVLLAPNVARSGFVRTRDLVRSTFDGITVGDGVGAEPGSLVMPISFDVGPGARVYVLDAGNARIQSFDATDGRHISQWGQFGAGDGEFDFANEGASKPNDFAGSIAVDDDGFIYVADVGNRRIQKFAP